MTFPYNRFFRKIVDRFVDKMELPESNKQFNDVNNLFLELVNLAKQINVLHKSTSNQRNVIHTEGTDLIVQPNPPEKLQKVYVDRSFNKYNAIDELKGSNIHRKSEIDSMVKTCCGSTINCGGGENMQCVSENLPNVINTVDQPSHKTDGASISSPAEDVNMTEFSSNVNEEKASMQLGTANLIGMSSNDIKYGSESTYELDGEFISCSAKDVNITGYSPNCNDENASMPLDGESRLAGNENLMSNGVNHGSESTYKLDDEFISSSAEDVNITGYSPNRNDEKASMPLGAKSRLDDNENMIASSSNGVNNEIEYTHKWDSETTPNAGEDVSLTVDDDILMDYSSSDMNHQNNAVQESERASFVNLAGGGSVSIDLRIAESDRVNGENDFDSYTQKTANSNESCFDFDQIEFISEAELATLEEYEILMDLDIELENTLHGSCLSKVELTTNQHPSSSTPKVQKHNNTKSICENFLFGNDEEISTSTMDNIELLPSQVSPHSLLMNVDPTQRSCDNTEMIMPTSNEGRKRLFCIYCKQNVSKLHRHLTTVHKKESEVKRFINLPKRSKQRLACLAQLRKRGMFMHNGNRKYNNGRFLSARRPNIKNPRNASDSITCAKCYGQYSKKYIRSHFKVCKDIDIDLNGERSVLVLGRMVEGRVHEDACDTLAKDIFPHMTEDNVVRLIRFDWLLIVYGNSLCDTNAEVFQYDGISAKLRLSGRLLTILKSIESDVTDFASMFRPKFYNSVIQSIRMVGKYDPVKKSYGAPSTSKAAVTLVRAVGVMLVAEYIKQEDAESQIRTENFNKLFNSGVVTSVSRGVYRTQAKMKRDKIEKLPSTEDIQLLAKYINKQLKVSFVDLSNQYSYRAYLDLARMTIASIIVFNRRRTGETQNILIENYHRREYLDDKWVATLPVEDRKLAKQYSRMKIRGKRDRTVPCLVKPKVDKSIELLIRHRKNARITDDNEFLFALPTIAGKRSRRVNACNVLRKLSTLCGAKEPELLRGTKMRKHVASMCISMELSESDVSGVAEFMGHHDKVHYDYYRKMPLVREIVKMSKLLETAQGDDDEDNGEISDDEEQDDPDGDYESWSHDDENVADCVEAIEEKNENRPDQDDEVSRVEIAECNGASEAKTEDWPDQEDGINCVAKAGPGEAKKKITRTRWSSEEVAAGHNLFSSDLVNKKLPSLKDINGRRNEILKNRTGPQIKAWLNNQMKKISNDIN